MHALHLFQARLHVTLFLTLALHFVISLTRQADHEMAIMTIKSMLFSLGQKQRKKAPKCD